MRFQNYPCGYFVDWNCFPEQAQFTTVFNRVLLAARLHRYDEAEAYLLKAIAICEDLDDEQVSLLRNIAFLYTELKRFTEAKE